MEDSVNGFTLLTIAQGLLPPSAELFQAWIPEDVPTTCYKYSILLLNDAGEPFPLR